MLGYQRLDVYKCAIQLLTACSRLSDDMPKGYTSLGEQLRRAAVSIPLNIAEGCGRSGTADGARFYAIARGSTMECGAILDVMLAIGSPHAHQIQESTTLVVRIVEMLTKMCR